MLGRLRRVGRKQCAHLHERSKADPLGATRLFTPNPSSVLRPTEPSGRRHSDRWPRYGWVFSLAPRLLPMRGFGLQRCASTWRPCAPLRAETDGRWDLSHVQLHDWPYFHRTVNLEDRAALGELHRLVQITGFDQRVAADDVLGLSKRPVGHCLLLAFH
jgi:hypothetical protein